MKEKYNQFLTYLQEINDLVHAQGLLGWDQQVNMPRGGAEARGNSLATLGKITHTKATSNQLGEMLTELEPYVKTLDPDSDEARMVKVVRRDYDKQKKVSTEWVGEFAKETTMGQAVWEQAKADNNFKLFEPQLEKLVALRRQYADFFKPFDHVYDPLLDDFEPGLKTADVKKIFNTLRPRQVELIKAISEKPRIDDTFLHISYPEKGQWDFGVEVLTKFGFDWNRGRQDKSVHPFTQGMGIGDVRITTRFDPERAASALFSTMHEGGHAMYDQGYDPRFDRTPLSTAASYAVHESQSRMWENLVGRSLAFWQHFYPRFQEIFPSQVGNVSLEKFYKGINLVEPSLIRVEADEATYNLHIMLRLEIEIALMEGTLKVKDLPEVWNTRMQEYLGLTPPNDAKGVLQDVHWSSGLIGYFPTYALGNLISVQLWDKMHQDIPTLDDQIEKGEFGELLGWLRKNIHSKGAKFEPQELVQQVTGSKIDPLPYLNYLETKYKKIYGF
jgi:carboxypeptidase Taq